ncbi:MAG: sensor histidine kinase [Proteobacteria bacterium]|nr:sensor histidine kinase [Pseudomonadota bacterium]
MRFDDRLDTVLRLRVNGAAAARIQFHQLIDLLGTTPAEARGATLDAAYVRLAELSRVLPAATRAAVLGQPGLRLRSPRLVAGLGSAEPPVAAAAMRAARLSEEQWLDLIPALPPAARAAMRDCPDPGPRARALLDRLGVRSRGLPPAENQAEAPAPVESAPAAPEPERVPEPELVPEPAPVMAPAATPAAAAAPLAIGAIVQRIEAFRRAREEGAPPPLPHPEAPRLPLGEEVRRAAPPQAFDFAADAAGRITWADPQVAPMVVGQSLAGNAALALPLRRRLPLRGLRVTLGGATLIAGEWQIDAQPQFDALTGRYTGYLGRLRRIAAPAERPTAANDDAGRLRQVLHELRTPVNAIQGFAEVIQQQLFGPVPHEYRALSAAIAADAARILGGFEELDRLAKLDSGALELPAGEADLGACLTATLDRLALRPGPARFALAAPAPAAPVALEPLEAERLCWRLLTTLDGAAAEGEQLPVLLRATERGAELAVQLPAALADLSDAALLRAGADAPEASRAAGMFGTGFALRLAMAEARAQGGELVRRKELVNLFLPLSSQARGEHHHGLPGTSNGQAETAASPRA